jgi:hypothetical protein
MPKNVETTVAEYADALGMLQHHAYGLVQHLNSVGIAPRVGFRPRRGQGRTAAVYRLARKLTLEVKDEVANCETPA